MTTGGSTSGRCTSPSSSVLPGKRPRASSSAAATPKGRLASVATAATLRLSSTATHSSADSLSHSTARLSLIRQRRTAKPSASKMRMAAPERRKSRKARASGFVEAAVTAKG